MEGEINPSKGLIPLKKKKKETVDERFFIEWKPPLLWRIFRAMELNFRMAVPGLGPPCIVMRDTVESPLRGKVLKLKARIFVSPRARQNPFGLPGDKSLSYETTSRFSAYKGLPPFVRLRCCSPSEPTLPPFLPHIVLSTGNGKRRRCYAILQIIRNNRIISSSNRISNAIREREIDWRRDRLIKWLLVRGIVFFFKSNFH